MAVRDDIRVNWALSPRIITILAPSTEITIQDLHDTLTDMEDEPANLGFDQIISTSGKEPLGGGVFVGLTATLLNAKIAFEARLGPDWVLCTISGGNLVAVDENGDEIDVRQPTAYTSVDRTSSSSATLQEAGAIQYSSFGGGVTVDLAYGVSGTEFPIGTPQAPVGNFDDALIILESRGFTTFFILGDATIDSSRDYSGLIFVGESMNKSELTISNGANVYRAEFYDAHIRGTLDGETVLQNCLIDDLDYINGFIQQCVLESGTITLGGSAEAHFLDCWSGVPGGPTPVIDLGGSGQALALRAYSGGIKLINKTGPESVSLDLVSGQIILDSTVTAGTIVCRGVGKLTDNSSGATIYNELISGLRQIDIEKALRNKMITDPDTGIMTVYDDDGVTPLWTAQIFEDADGTQTYRRDGIERRERLE